MEGWAFPPALTADPPRSFKRGQDGAKDRPPTSPANGANILTGVTAVAAIPDDELVQATIDVIGSGIAVLDGNGYVSAVNDMWRTQASESGCIGGSAGLRDYYVDACLQGDSPSLDARRFAKDVRRVLAGQAAVAAIEYEVTGEEDPHWFQTRAHRAAGFHPPRFLITHEDVTSIRGLRSGSLGTADAAVLAVDAGGSIRIANDAAGMLFGLSADLLIGRPFGGLVAVHSDTSGDELRWWVLADNTYAAPSHEPAVIRVLRNDGGEFTAEARTVSIDSVDPDLTSIVIRDLTDRRRLAAMLEFNAFRDPVTGLPNRTLLFDRLQADIQWCNRHNSMIAVFLVDLDDIDNHGDPVDPELHNQIIKIAAARLQETVRAGDTVARLEGGRFVVVVRNLQEIGDACFAVQRLRQRIARPVLTGDRVLGITAGIGVAVFPWESQAADALLDSADAALRAARSVSPTAAIGGSDVFRDLIQALTGGSTPDA